MITDDLQAAADHLITELCAGRCVEVATAWNEPMATRKTYILDPADLAYMGKDEIADYCDIWASNYLELTKGEAE
jgi:hypothetical protein